jgi:nitrogen fixation protein FixH
MKWNWGTKLMLVFGFFMLGMIALVAMSMRQKVELVARDYYSDELRYQQVVDATQRAQALERPLTVAMQGDKLVLQLPQQAGGAAITGEVHFYCAADGTKDKRIVLQADENGAQAIPAQLLKPGRYTAKVNWRYEGNTYYAEQPLNVE